MYSVFQLISTWLILVCNWLVPNYIKLILVCNQKDKQEENLAATVESIFFYIMNTPQSSSEVLCGLQENSYD